MDPKDIRRTPGMPPMGGEKMGPVGGRIITPEKAQALAELAKAGTQPVEAPPAIPPEPSAETPKEDNPLPDKKDSFAELQQNPFSVKDILHYQRMTFLDSEERRKKIEERCDPAELDFTDYILRGQWRQKVYLWGPKESGRPFVEFRSTHVDDELIIREYQAGQYAGTNNLDLTQALLMVAAGVVRIGEDRVFPELPAGDCDYGARKKIFAECLKMAKGCWSVLWDIYINYLWFQGRIRRSMYGADAPF
jgi:hypothetical protein